MKIIFLEMARPDELTQRVRGGISPTFQMTAPNPLALPGYLMLALCKKQRENTHILRLLVKSEKKCLRYIHIQIKRESEKGECASC